MTSQVEREGNARTRFIRSQSITRMLRAQGVSYASKNAYASAVRCAIKAGTQTPGGMRYHSPEYTGAKFDEHSINFQPEKRIYLIWEGQTVAQIEEALAFAIMIERVPFVVLCPYQG